MKNQEKIDTYRRFSASSDWQFVKTELLKLKADLEERRRNLVKFGDMTSVSNIEGMIEGLEIAVNYSESQTKILSQMNLRTLAEKVMEEAYKPYRSVHKMFKDAFLGDKPDTE